MIERIFKNMLLAQILSSAAVTICMLVDSIMIGQYLGVDAVAAYGLASPVLFVFAALGALISTGIQVVCGKAMAAGDKDEVNRYYTASLIAAAVIAFVGLLLVYIFTNPICSLLGATKGTIVFDMTKRYLRGFMFGAPAFIAAQIFVPYMQLSNNGTRLVVAVSAMTVVDITLDILNVKVFLGGMFGMGVASAASYYVAIVIAGLYLLSKKCIFKFVPKSINMKYVWKLFKCGIPTAVNQICYTLQVFTINQILVAAGSTDGVAVYAVLSTVGSLCFSVGGGIGAVALTLSGIFYVEEDRHSIEKLVKIFVKYALILDAIVIVVFFIFAPGIMNLFLSGGTAAAKLGAFAMRLFILCLIPSSLNTSFKNYYQGVTKTWLTQVISVLQNYVFVALAAFVLSAFFETTGVWLSFVTGEALTLLTLAIIVWKKSHHITFRAEDFAYLDSDFGIPDENVIELPINSVEGVNEASIMAGKFCQDRSGDSQKAMYVSLCIEEMGNNVMQHGFSDGKKHYMQLRVLYKKDTWIVAFRDDCKVFDPVSYRKIWKAEKNADHYSHIGISLVFNMAKNVTYVNTLGLNNLTIVL